MPHLPTSIGAQRLDHLVPAPPRANLKCTRPSSGSRRSRLRRSVPRDRLSGCPRSRANEHPRNLVAAIPWKALQYWPHGSRNRQGGGKRLSNGDLKAAAPTLDFLAWKLGIPDRGCNATCCLRQCDDLHQTLGAPFTKDLRHQFGVPSVWRHADEDSITASAQQVFLEHPPDGHRVTLLREKPLEHRDRLMELREVVHALIRMTFEMPTSLDGLFDRGLSVGGPDRAEIFPSLRMRVMRQVGSGFVFFMATEYRRRFTTQPRVAGSPSMSAFVRTRRDRAVRTDVR